MTGANARKQQFLEFANRQAAAHNTGANRKHRSKEHLVSIELCDDTQGKEAFLQWGELPNQGHLCWKLYRHPPRLQGFARAGCCGLLIYRLQDDGWIEKNSIDALMAKVGKVRDDSVTSYQVVESFK
jgi:hypothetical protein